MSRRRPALMFYKGDWLKDPELSMCSPAARGIWMDLLCAMDDAEYPGRLSGTLQQLARVARCTAEEMGAALTELGEMRAAHVTGCNGKNVTCSTRVTVENRRMVRESEEREKTRLRVARHRKKKAEKADVTSDVTPPSSVAVAVSRTTYEEQQQPLLAPSSAQRDEANGDPGGSQHNGKPPPEKQPRKADPIWDALMSACGINGSIPKSARGAYNRARSDLAAAGATPEEIKRRADIYRRQWPTVSITPTALTRRWAECEREMKRPNPSGRRIEARRQEHGEATAEILSDGRKN